MQNKIALFYDSKQIFATVKLTYEKLVHFIEVNINLQRSLL
jgi:hypothetical protein